MRALLILLLLSGTAFGQVGPPMAGQPTKVVCVDYPSTITAGGTAQVALAANVNRKLAWITNNSASEGLAFSFAGTANTNSSTLGAGSAFSWPPSTISTAALSVYAATSAHPFTVVECQ